MKISSVMNKVVTVEGDLILLKVAKVFVVEKISSLVMVKNGKAIGIITERDIMRNITCLKKKMSKVMTKELVTVTSGKNLENAASLMHKKKIKRLLVVDRGELVGIITATDLIANADMLNRSFSFLE
jgi:CBS domain-containing protein